MSKVAWAKVGALCFSSLAAACDIPETFVVLDNNYPTDAAALLVAYQASWQAVSFPAPVPPGGSSEPQSTVAASPNTAYVLLAPGWDPTSPAPPASIIVLQSRDGFGVHLGDTMHIPLSDSTFVGNCAAGSVLTQAQADFITEFVFPRAFGSLSYDAATCTVTSIGDAGDDAP
jgi:hypothetical protein